MKLFLQDNNIDIKEFINKNLGEVSRDLINNPQFESQLYRELVL